MTKMHSIFFMHIPKTAGTSVIRVIGNNLSLSDYLAMQRIRELYSATCYIDQELLFRTKVICGHIPLSLSSFQKEPVLKLTFLREPISLALSTFNHYKKTKQIDPDVRLLEFLESNQSDVLANIQTRWIAEYNIPAIDDRRMRTKPLESGILEKAICNLDQFNFIGIVENSLTSMKFLSHMLGYDFLDMPILNQGDYSQSIDQKSLEILVELNKFDKIIYDIGRQRNAQMLSVSAKQYFPSVRTKSILISKFRAFVDFDFPVNCKGFHERELWSPWGTVRWTKDRAEVEIPCTIEAGVAYSFRCLVISVIDRSIAHEVTFYINDVILNSHFAVEDTVFRYDAQFQVDHTIVSPILQIHVPFATSPKSISSVLEDERQLGLALKWIYISPNDKSLEEGYKKDLQLS